MSVNWQRRNLRVTYVGEHNYAATTSGKSCVVADQKYVRTDERSLLRQWQQGFVNDGNMRIARSVQSGKHVLS